MRLCLAAAAVIWTLVWAAKYFVDRMYTDYERIRSDEAIWSGGLCVILFALLIAIARS